MSGVAASPENCYMTHKYIWREMGSQKDVDQGSNKDGEAKVAHIEKFAGGKSHR